MYTFPGVGGLMGGIFFYVVALIIQCFLALGVFFMGKWAANSFDGGAVGGFFKVLSYLVGIAAAAWLFFDFIYQLGAGFWPIIIMAVYAFIMRIISAFV